MFLPCRNLLFYSLFLPLPLFLKLEMYLKRGLYFHHKWMSLSIAVKAEGGHNAHTHEVTKPLPGSHLPWVGESIDEGRGGVSGAPWPLSRVQSLAGRVFSSRSNVI